MAGFITNSPTKVTIGANYADFFKDLNGYPHYRAADVLRPGDPGGWMFDLSVLGGNLASYSAATVTFSLVDDDHYGIPLGDYSESIVFNGTTAFNGALALQHGAPFGSVFQNWGLFSFNPSNIFTPFVISMQNTGTAGLGDWIAIDTVDLRLTRSTGPVLEPASRSLFALGGLVLALRLNRFLEAGASAACGSGLLLTRRNSGAFAIVSLSASSIRSELHGLDTRGVLGALRLPRTNRFLRRIRNNSCL